MSAKLEREKAHLKEQAKLKREKAHLEKQIESRRKAIKEQFPEILQIDSEEKVIDFKKNISCYKCFYLKYESTMEEIKEHRRREGFMGAGWRFHYSGDTPNKETGYCCHTIGEVRTMIKIEKPKLCICDSYQLKTEIDLYLSLIQQKYRMIREAKENKEAKIAKITKELNEMKEKAKEELEILKE